jgi:hypothetical protein
MFSLFAWQRVIVTAYFGVGINFGIELVQELNSAAT